MGHGKFHVYSILTNDLKKLISTSMGTVSHHYHYDNENLLLYKIQNVNTSIKSDYVQSYRLEEIKRDDKKRIVKKEIYDYKESIVRNSKDLKKMQEMDRRISSVWEYQYNENNQVVKLSF